jgi:ketosteroid isomerase-like protein
VKGFLSPFLILEKIACMRLLFIPIIFVFISFKANQITGQVGQLIKADKEFSELSRQKGMRYAFLQYVDDAGVLLRKNHYPLVGQDAKNLIRKIDDSSFTLTWEPSAAFIARSGELGYTYGVYRSRSRDTTTQGTYVTIWKKQKDGKWKFVLDSGNEGVGQ